MSTLTILCGLCCVWLCVALALAYCVDVWTDKPTWEDRDPYKLARELARLYYDDKRAAQPIEGPVEMLARFYAERPYLRPSACGKAPCPDTAQQAEYQRCTGGRPDPHAGTAYDGKYGPCGSKYDSAVIPPGYNRHPGTPLPPGWPWGNPPPLDCSRDPWPGVVAHAARQAEYKPIECGIGTPPTSASKAAHEDHVARQNKAAQ